MFYGQKITFFIKKCWQIVLCVVSCNQREGNETIERNCLWCWYLKEKKLKNCWQSSSVMIQYNQSKGKGSEQNEEKAE